MPFNVKSPPFPPLTSPLSPPSEGGEGEVAKGGRGGFERGMFPVAEYVSDRVISLPLYPKMSVSDVRYVIKVVKEVIEGFRK